MHFELFFQKIGNLKHFVTDIKSKLRDEFSALMMLADAEEEILGSQESGKVMYVGLDFLEKPTMYEKFIHCLHSQNEIWPKMIVKSGLEFLNSFLARRR